MASSGSFRQRWNDYKASKGTLAWACVAGIVGTAIVGFTWGGWVTGGKAQTMATAAADDARSELVASLCVDRFNAGQNVAAQMEELKKTQSWSRRDFIEKGGWVAVPGKPMPTRQAATRCADQLLAANAATPASVTVGN